MNKILLPPFTLDNQLADDELAKQVLISQAGLSEVASGVTNDHCNTYLHEETHAPVLEELYPYLWLVAKKSSKHIDALHQHRIKNRDIVIAEDPGLHLVWYNNIVYLKPVPLVLLNHDFWHKHLVPAATQSAGQVSVDIETLSQKCRASLGLLRSYSYLIAHESDFHIAQEKHLIPKDITHFQLQRFLKPFRSVPDDAVCRRFQYGQIRLTRLNWAVRLCRPKTSGRAFPWNYQERYWQTGQYLGRFGAPLLFVFATTSLILSAIQVVHGALGTDTWPGFVRASWGFAIAVLILIAGIIVCALLGILGLLLIQAQFALRMYLRDVFASQPFKV